MESESRIQERLLSLLTPLVAPLGYEIVYVEVQTHRQGVLRVFIDHAESGRGGIGIEDCVNVSRALQEPLDQLEEVDKLFHGPYELEVSSPGVDRPLRLAKDFERFRGHDVRIHVFRPLTAEELGNGDYKNRNPKQKNFLGTIKALEGDKVVLDLAPGAGSEPGKKGKPAKKAGKPTTNSVELAISIPIPLISKANLEPDFSDIADSMKESVQS